MASPTNSKKCGRKFFMILFLKNEFSFLFATSWREGLDLASDSVIPEQLTK
jgi:hypothetical protein